jgi:hypothetical protein
VSPGHRRDFLLDSGAISALASDRDLLTDYVELVEHQLDGSLLIPVPVLTEVHTGDPRHDVPVDRLIKTLRGAQEDVYVHLTVPIALRAGTLRSQALKSAKREISVTDAHIVAMADDLADHSAVTILTEDPDDMKLLVGVTRWTNIAVDVPG